MEFLSDTQHELQTRKILRRSILQGLFWLLALIYLELLLHEVIFGHITGRFFYVLGFTAVIACLISAVTALFKKRVNANLTTGLVCFFCVLYVSQMIYYYIFGTMYSLAMVGLGGNAITNFWKEMLSSIWEHFPVLLLTFAPIPAVCLLRKFAGDIFETNRNSSRLWMLVVAVALQIVMLLCLRAGGTGFYTAYSYYHGNDATTDQTAENFGLLTTFRLEFQHMFRENDGAGYFVEESGDGDSSAEYGYNVLEIDFDELNEKTEDERIREINNYCKQLAGTQKNEYTGMLKDYNLIVLCAESFSTAAIDKERTPTLWKLSHEGIVFNNYYNTYPNTTTDGEYSLCQGLLPDKTRGKTASSFYASRDSYLPMCLGNIFREQRGIQSYGYHNYTSDFYGRYESHPNMGYQMKFAGQGMSFTTSWPSSDLEMMEQSIPDYLHQTYRVQSDGTMKRTPFHAYYMTFSGHYKYDLNNPMVQRNWDAVKDLPYSNPAKCYISCNLELEKAMAYLMEQLEQAGVADRTAIVLAGDHFPYGLTNEQYGELVGHEIDYFEAYKDTLIFWVGGLEEPIEVDEYCCNIDILPTILNLWGFDYDSRLLAGTDVFSGGTHIAILADQSFLTDKVWFDANSNTAKWLVDEDSVAPGYLENMIHLVKNRFTISTDILNTAYYNFVFGKEAVRVNTAGWITEEEWNGTGKTDEEENGLPPDYLNTPPQEGDPDTPVEGTDPGTDPVQDPEDPGTPTDPDPGTEPPDPAVPDPPPDTDPQVPPPEEPQTGTTDPDTLTFQVAG